jgi:hypothetical protein
MITMGMKMPMMTVIMRAEMLLMTIVGMPGMLIARMTM